jgi:hypothetical protein
MIMANGVPPNNSELISLLDHARGQFQYHAGQRLTSIRYFFATYAVFAAGYFGLFVKDTKAPLFAQLALSVIALIVTLAFWILDVRNAELVEIDEDAMKEIEGKLAPTFGLTQFDMTRNWEHQTYRKVRGECRQRMVKYGFIVRLLFLVIALFSAAAIVQSFYALLHPTP